MTEIREIMKKLRMCANIAAIHHNPNMHVYLTELEQALDKAEADTKRLDWIDVCHSDLALTILAYNCSAFNGESANKIELMHGYRHVAKTDNIRDLIDKAMVDKNIDTKQ